MLPQPHGDEGGFTHTTEPAPVPGPSPPTRVRPILAGAGLPEEATPELRLKPEGSAGAACARPWGWGGRTVRVGWMTSGSAQA